MDREVITWLVLLNNSGLIDIINLKNRFPEKKTIH